MPVHHHRLKLFLRICQMYLVEFLGWGLADVCVANLRTIVPFTSCVRTLLFTYILVKLRKLLHTSFRQKLELYHATNSGDGHTQTQI